jgi:hypothetical protein
MTDDKTKVELIDFNDRISRDVWPFEVANYGENRKHGLTVYGCECGAHCYALPWDDAMERWFSHQVSPLKAFLEDRGIRPEKPAPSPHVVLIDHEDAHILTRRRWRVFPSRRGYRARHFLQSGRRGLPIQRFIRPKAECITFINGNGLDLRRCNVRRTTMRVLLRERDAGRRKARAAVRRGEKIGTVRGGSILKSCQLP